MDTMTRETRRMLEDSRLTLEQFLDATNKTPEAYREELQPEATERVKRDLGLAALADAEHIVVDDDEGAQWYEMMTALTTGRRERWNSLNASQKRSIIARLRRDKALDRMVEIATEGKWPPAAEETTETAEETTGTDQAVAQAATEAASAQANAAVAARAGAQTAEQDDAATAEKPAAKAEVKTEAKPAAMTEAMTEASADQEPEAEA